MTSKHDPIAYTYEADYHCPACAEARFGRNAFGIAMQVNGESDNDREGNPVGAVFAWDEWCEPSATGTQTLACGTCGDVIEEHEHLDPDADPDDWGTDGDWSDEAVRLFDDGMWPEVF